MGLRKACFIDHLEITSTIVKKDSEEVNNSFTFYLPYRNHNMKGKKQLIYNEKIKAETEAKMGAPVSRFQCVERGTQYRNSMKREVEVQTQGPPKEVFSGNIDRFVITTELENFPLFLCRGIIHDVYVQYEKKTETKESKNEETVKQRRRLVGGKPSGSEENTERMLLSAKILERMINQNIYAEIVFDFKYWEDRSDEFKEVEGSLYPLWRFECEESANQDVTSLVWNTFYPDMFAAGYGSYNFYRQPRSGLICVFSLKNSSHPEYLLAAPAGVLSVAFHTLHPHLLVAGLADGNVALYNLVRNRHSPLLLSSPMTGKHSDLVWRVVWCGDDLDGHLNFLSTSADGTVKLWTVVRTFLRQTELFRLSFDRPLSVQGAGADLTDGGTALSLCPGPGDNLGDNLGGDQYLVGTEEGNIHICTTNFSSAALLR